MATYKVRHKPGNYQTDAEIKQVLDYAKRPNKTDKEKICGGAVLPELAALSMECVTDAYHNENGTHLRHSILSFSPEDPITVDDAINIGKAAIQYYEDDYQILAAVHTDHAQPHIHFVMNTTSYQTGDKYKGDRKDYHAFHRYLNKVVKPYGISVTLTK